MLTPSEWTGEGCLAGRVVLLRLVELGQAGNKDIGTQAPTGKGKSGGKGKAKSAVERMKCEVHLLGGKTRGEVVLCEGWGEAAQRLHTVAKQCQKEGKLLSLSNVKVVNQYNQYSTSRLPYFVRCMAGSMVVEKVVATGRWAEIPEHHPFLDIEKMTKVESNQQHCVLGARCQREVKLTPRA